VAPADQNRIGREVRKKPGNILGKVLAVPVQRNQILRVTSRGSLERSSYGGALSQIVGMATDHHVDILQKFPQIGIGAAIIDDQHF
jgi:hypothetical protein